VRELKLPRLSLAEPALADEAAEANSVDTFISDRLSPSSTCLPANSEEDALSVWFLARNASRALETLGHAIEYLADEYVRDDAPPSQKEGMMQAIQILMATNRDIYFSSPKTPTLRERLRALLRR
jgi:hypothetical protein